MLSRRLLRGLSTLPASSSQAPSQAPPPRKKLYDDTPTYTHIRADDASQATRRNPRTVFVRPWDGVRTMAHFFTIVREVERKYGEVQEFVVTRSTDLLSAYWPSVHVTFAREEDAAQILSAGAIMRVPPPRGVDALRSGGVGLDDLQVYIDPGMRVKWEEERTKEDEEGKVGDDWMDVKIERTNTRNFPDILDYTYPAPPSFPPIFKNPERTEEFAQAMHAFGGFVPAAPVAPLPLPGTDPSSPDFIHDPYPTRTLMQKCVAEWSSRRKDTSADVLDDGRGLAANAPVQPGEWFKAISSHAAGGARNSQENLTLTHGRGPGGPLNVDSAHQSEAQEDTQERVSWALPTDVKPEARPKSTIASSWKPTTAKKHVSSAPTPGESKLSKKQRMLHAARSAGSTPRTSEPPRPPNPSPTDPGIASSAEAMIRAGWTTASPGASNTKNADAGAESGERGEGKAAARKWWDFFKRGS